MIGENEDYGTIVSFCHWGGLGDMLISSAAMGAAWEERGQVFDVWCSRYPEVWDNLPFVTRVTVKDGIGHPQAIPLIIMRGQTDDPTDGLVHQNFNALGLNHVPIENRRMRYVVTEEERARVRPLLPALERPIIGLQVNGGWKTKYWSHWQEFARLCVHRGYRVAIVKQEPAGLNRELRHDPMVIDLGGKLASVRDLGAIQSYLSCWVGFDSGPSYLANAVGIPSVWRWATHNPAYLLGMVGNNAPHISIWPNWIDRCGRERGITCRIDHGFPTGSNGGECPHRNGGIGSDCLDSLSPEYVMQFVQELLEEA